MHISGSFGPAAASSFSGQELLFHFDGPLNGDINYGDVATIGLHFVVAKTGGDVLFDGAMLNTNGAVPFVFAAGYSTNLSGDFHTTITSDPSYSMDPVTITAGYWSLDVGLIWTGANPTDTLSVTIPNNSIDVSVPEPLSGSILLLPAAVLLARRSRGK